MGCARHHAKGADHGINYAEADPSLPIGQEDPGHSHEMLGGLLFIAVALLSALALVLIVHFAANKGPAELPSIQCGGTR